MPLAHELAWLVKQRCDEIGLTPEQLAALSGAPIAVVRQLLEAKGEDLRISLAERVANAVGLSVGVIGLRRRHGDAGAAVIASRTASTSFKEQIPPDAVSQALSTGHAPANYQPHLRTLLEEAPLGLLADLAHELHELRGTPPSQTWQQMRSMASALGCLRDIWQ